MCAPTPIICSLEIPFAVFLKNYESRNLWNNRDSSFANCFAVRILVIVFMYRVTQKQRNDSQSRTTLSPSFIWHRVLLLGVIQIFLSASVSSLQLNMGTLTLHTNVSNSLLLYHSVLTYVLFFSLALLGLLTVGKPKTWEDSKKDLGYIRTAGVRQFISTYNRVKDLQGNELLWGDEIEYGVFKLDHEQKKVRLSLRAKAVSTGDSVLFPIRDKCTASMTNLT